MLTSSVGVVGEVGVVGLVGWAPVIAAGIGSPLDLRYFLLNTRNKLKRKERERE